MSDDFPSSRAALAHVVAIPVTPFAEDGSVDRDRHAALLHRLVDGGVRVVTANGNTGEFYTLDPAEARGVAQQTVKEIGGRATVVVGVGLDAASAIAAARHARDCGAPLIMIHQPVHPYVSAEGWREYHRVIAAAVPDVGVVPYVRDPRIPGGQLARLADDCPNVVGVKYAVADPVRFAAFARDAGLERFTWLAGLAELSAPGYFAVGATGFTSGLANVVPAIALTLHDELAARRPDAALRTWERIRPFEELRAADSGADNVSVVKEALAQLGLCRPDVRPPSSPPPPAVREQIAAILADWGDRWEI